MFIISVKFYNLFHFLFVFHFFFMIQEFHCQLWFKVWIKGSKANWRAQFLISQEDIREPLADN